MFAIQRSAAKSQPGAEPKSLQQLMEELYARQLALDPSNAYLVEHGTQVSIANQVRTFHWYRPYLPDVGTVLDWGCNHAPDSCLLRAWYGDRVSLHSCDFVAADRYQVFHDFAGAQHERLVDEVAIPFPANLFDAVIASGVLEHVPLDYESLKELRRVLKPDGVLVISYLPNWLSINEWTRRVKKRDFHRRLYGIAETKRLLKRSGFYPVEAGYHTFFWERLVSSIGLCRWEGRLSSLLAQLLPMQVFSSTLRLVARKVTMM